MIKMIEYSMGGSDRQYKKDSAMLKNAGIRYKQMGALTLGSKKVQIGVSAENADQMTALEFSKCRHQRGMDWFHNSEPITYFNDESIEYLRNAQKHGFAQNESIILEIAIARWQLDTSDSRLSAMAYAIQIGDRRTLITVASGIIDESIPTYADIVDTARRVFNAVYARRIMLQKQTGKE